MADVVFSAENLSAAIVRDLWRSGLLTAATDVAQPFLRDPKAAARAANRDASPFVMTSFPDRNAFYPLIVVEEASNDLDRIDRRGALQAGNYDVSVTIYSETKTDLAKLKDGVKKWAIRNLAALQTAGFIECHLISSNENTWDETSRVLTHRLVYRGLVHAT